MLDLKGRRDLGPSKEDLLMVDGRFYQTDYTPALLFMGDDTSFCPRDHNHRVL